MPQEKIATYAALILDKINELIEEQELQNELEEPDNATAFIHAFTNIAPHLFMESTTDLNTDTLGFTHIANRLAVQFSSGPRKDGTIKY